MDCDSGVKSPIHEEFSVPGPFPLGNATAGGTKGTVVWLTVVGWLNTFVPPPLIPPASWDTVSKSCCSCRFSAAA